MQTEITTFFNDVNLCVEVNWSILGPGLIRHRSVQPFFSRFSHVCLVGPNNKICVFRVTTPKKLGRVGRDFFF